MTISTFQEPRQRGDLPHNLDAETSGYRQLFEKLHKSITAQQILLISTLPRAGTQIVQPASCPDVLLKIYQREAFLDDRPTWQSILRQRVLIGEECWSSAWTRSTYYSTFMQPHGLRQVLVAPVVDPLLSGYPGALHFYRGDGQSPFSDADRKQAEQLAQQVTQLLLNRRRGVLNGASERLRDPAESVEGTEASTASEQVEKLQQTIGQALRVGRRRQFIFDAAAREVELQPAQTPVDPELLREMRVLAERRLESRQGAAWAQRVQIPDSNRRLWAFRAADFERYPALGSGRYVIFCFQPSPCEWYALSPADFQADPEFMRLLPTLRFMREEFPRNPTLNEIALKAHLSPFHFHRRFSELLGQTPKHFLLDCQVQLAMRLLRERVPLSEIARRCGFAHQSHFTSRFKQAIGLTPTRWRRLALEQKEPAVGLG